MFALGHAGVDGSPVDLATRLTPPTDAFEPDTTLGTLYERRAQLLLDTRSAFHDGGLDGAIATAVEPAVV
jgi:hypothetical protein